MEEESNLSEKRKKIYDSKFRCCECRKVIGEYSSKNRQRVVSSWASICMRCLNKLKKKLLV